MMRRAMLLALAGALAFACDDPADSLLGDRQKPDGEEEGVEPGAENVQAGPAMMRNLSNREFLTAASDLIGERLPSDLLKGWTPTTQFSGFDAVPWTNLDAKAVRDRADTVELILDRAIASPKVMTCSVSSPDALSYDACAKKIVEPFASRGFGRKLTQAEAASFAKTYDAAAALAKTMHAAPDAVFKEAIRVVLGSVLLAPQFITRDEPPPSPDFSGERDLTAYELANRLSFMFLGSLPDDELWSKAEDGSLTNTEVLVAQTKRLLDTKTDTFVQTFMGQWFDFRAFDGAKPGTIEHAMFTESWRTLADVIREDLSVAALLKPGFTYVNRDLAAHYGIHGQFSADFQRVPIKERGGVLQQGSWLTLSATPLKTSPIHRGRLVQDRLLCKVIPPPDSELFEKIQEVSASIPPTATVKQRVEVHRSAGPACKGCHEYMDPIGIGLEGFDQFGKVRTVYADTGMKVETDSNILGTPFANFAGLNDTLADMADYRKCAAEKLAVYSLRRVVDASAPAEAELLGHLSAPAGDKPATIRTMILRLVKSKAFRKVNHGAKR